MYCSPLQVMGLCPAMLLAWHAGHLPLVSLWMSGTLSVASVFAEEG